MVDSANWVLQDKSIGSRSILRFRKVHGLPAVDLFSREAQKTTLRDQHLISVLNEGKQPHRPSVDDALRLFLFDSSATHGTKAITSLVTAAKNQWP